MERICLACGEPIHDSDNDLRDSYGWHTDLHARCYPIVYAALAAAPQPDADEREAMVVAMSMDIRDNIDIEWAEAKTVADALLAAGWTRKREEG